MFAKKRSLAFGHVDQFSHGVLYGWAWNPSEPNQRINIDIFLDGCFMGQFAASDFRPDLNLQGIGDGRYGFKAHISDTLDAKVNLDRFLVLTTYPNRVRLNHPGAKRSLHGHSVHMKRDLLGRWRDMFQTLVERIVAADHNVAQSTPYHLTQLADTRLKDMLLGPSLIGYDVPLHGHEITAYADFIRHKYSLDKTYQTQLAGSEFNGFLKWYLENYGAAQGEKFAPLSAADIAYLNSQIEIDSSGRTINRAAVLFLQDYGRPLPKDKPLSQTDHDDIVYWWAVEESRKLFVHDALITDNQREQLRRISKSNLNGDYPFSIFMMKFVSRNMIFDGLNLQKPENRKIAYFVLLLYSLRLPHIVDFIPEPWLNGIIENSLEPGSIHGFFTDLFGRSISKNLVDHFRFHLLSGTSPRAEIPRVFTAHLKKPDRPKVDVQIIGPFRRILGLGQSCRILADAIDRLDYRLNLFDWDLQNGSPIDMGKGRFDTLSTARINILHLNPETLPEAIAYLPDVFSDAFNIGFCYWELPTPARCQLLGLSLPDEIWVASDYIANAFRPFCKSLVNIGMAYDATPPPKRQPIHQLMRRPDISERDFVFLQISDALSWAQRKNPIAAIQAFIRAFPNEKDVKLIIKTHNVSSVTLPEQQKLWAIIKELAATDPRIIFIDETFSRERHRELIAACHCLVSLHRSEGFGLDILEAVRFGVPVMATAYSGPLAFCTEQSAWLVPYDEIFLSGTDYAFAKPGDKWADPRLQDSISVMREIYLSESKRKQMALNGLQFVESRFSPEAFSKHIDVRLSAILSAI